MSQTMQELRDQLVETARAVARGGAISLSGHGNISIRIPGRDEMLYTAEGSLHNFTAAGIARIGLDGTVLEGEVPPMAAAVISMHQLIYQERPETGCVLHTHAPFATAFALANKPIEGWTEAFGIFGLEDGVPLAAYGARGSEQAIQNIREALTPKTQAVLLANHGVLCFHRTAQMAAQVNVIVEEAAQAAIYAGCIGGARVVPPELLHSSKARAEQFEAAGAQRAERKD
ncbi:MAG TPA: class II aldolase/adducin family protein [Ktedonobacterales bacterium]|nr:class II aldolase/adducin family protein [Ktedonobacterales bacterium]